jgi:hypothetical protein
MRSCSRIASKRGHRQNCIKIAYSLWLGFLPKLGDFCPWSGRVAQFARPGRRLFRISPSSFPPRCPLPRLTPTTIDSCFNNLCQRFDGIQVIARSYGGFSGYQPCLISKQFRHSRRTSVGMGPRISGAQRANFNASQGMVDELPALAFGADLRNAEWGFLLMPRRSFRRNQRHCGGPLRSARVRRRSERGLPSSR